MPLNLKKKQLVVHLFYLLDGPLPFKFVYIVLYHLYINYTPFYLYLRIISFKSL